MARRAARRWSTRSATASPTTSSSTATSRTSSASTSTRSRCVRSVPTDAGGRGRLEAMLARLDAAGGQAAPRPRRPRGGDRPPPTAEELEALAAELRAEPERYIAQPTVTLSVTRRWSTGGWSRATSTCGRSRSPAGRRRHADARRPQSRRPGGEAGRQLLAERRRQGHLGPGLAAAGALPAAQLGRRRGANLSRSARSARHTEPDARPGWVPSRAPGARRSSRGCRPRSSGRLRPPRWSTGHPRPRPHRCGCAPSGCEPLSRSWVRRSTSSARSWPTAAMSATGAATIPGAAIQAAFTPES